VVAAAVVSAQPARRERMALSWVTVSSAGSLSGGLYPVSGWSPGPRGRSPRLIELHVVRTSTMPDATSTADHPSSSSETSGSSAISSSTAERTRAGPSTAVDPMCTTQRLVAGSDLPGAPPVDRCPGSGDAAGAPLEGVARCRAPQRQRPRGPSAARPGRSALPSPGRCSQAAARGLECLGRCGGPPSSGAHVTPSRGRP
jgi:hypothetical protein